MDELTKKATQLLRIRDHEHRRIITQIVQQCTGISHSQHLLLMQLHFHSFKSQKELASHLNISPAAVTMSLKKLETEGYVEKNINPKDTRFNFVTLTPKGKHVVTYSMELFQAIDNTIFTGFSQEEIEALSGYIERITKNLKQIEETQPFQTLDLQKDPYEG